MTQDQFAFDVVLPLSLGISVGSAFLVITCGGCQWLWRKLMSWKVKWKDELGVEHVADVGDLDGKESSMAMQFFGESNQERNERLLREQQERFEQSKEKGTNSEEVRRLQEVLKASLLHGAVASGKLPSGPAKAQAPDVEGSVEVVAVRVLTEQEKSVHARMLEIRKLCAEGGIGEPDAVRTYFEAHPEVLSVRYGKRIGCYVLSEKDGRSVRINGADLQGASVVKIKVLDVPAHAEPEKPWEQPHDGLKRLDGSVCYCQRCNDHRYMVSAGRGPSREFYQ